MSDSKLHNDSSKTPRVGSGIGLASRDDWTSMKIVTFGCALFIRSRLRDGWLRNNGLSQRTPFKPRCSNRCRNTIRMRDAGAAPPQWGALHLPRGVPLAPARPMDRSCQHRPSLYEAVPKCVCATWVAGGTGALPS